MRLLNYLLVVSCLVLSACGTPPALLSPAPEVARSQTGALYRSPALDQTDHINRHLNKDKSIIYHQNFGGGGVALGLLGPLGVAANMKMIESNTERDVALLEDKIDIDPIKAFSAAASDIGYPIREGGNPSAPKFSPYILVMKVREGELQVGAAMFVNVNTGGANWGARYMYQLPAGYTVESLSSLDRAAMADLDRQLTAGFSELIKMFKSDNPESTKNERPIVFKSEFLSPRYDFEMRGALMAESDTRVWVRSVGSIYSLAKSEVRITPVQ